MSLIVQQGFIVREGEGGGGGTGPEFLLPADALFLGNSQTRGDPSFVPIISVVDGLSDLDGFGDIVVDNYTTGGATLKILYEDAACIAKITSKMFTHYVLQGQSLEANPDGAGYSNFIGYGKLLAAAIYEHNPNARIFLYVTLPYNQDNSVGGNPNVYPSVFANPKEMRDKNRSGYLDLRNQIRSANPDRYPAEIVDICSEFYGLGSTPSPAYRSLQVTDGLHMNDDGRVVIGCSFYVKLCGRDPTPYVASMATAIGQTLVLDPEDIGTWAYNYIINSELPPFFELQPTGGTVTAGQNVILTVNAVGTPTPTLQWYKDGVAIPGATSSSYSIPSMAAGDEADYFCRAINSEGTADSNTASLVIGVVGPELKLDFSGASVTTDTGWTTVLATDATKALVNASGGVSGCNWVRTTLNQTNVASQGSTDGSAYNPPVPTNAVNDYWFGSDTDPFIEGYIENLPVGAVYNVRYIACRSGIPNTENRHSKITVTGVGSVNGQLNAAGNLTNTLTVGTVTVPANGRLTFRFEKGASNDNASGFYYANEVSLIPA